MSPLLTGERLREQRKAYPIRACSRRLAYRSRSIGRTLRVEPKAPTLRILWRPLEAPLPGDSVTPKPTIQRGPFAGVLCGNVVQAAAQEGESPYSYRASVVGTEALLPDTRSQYGPSGNILPTVPTNGDTDYIDMLRKRTV